MGAERETGDTTHTQCGGGATHEGETGAVRADTGGKTDGIDTAVERDQDVPLKGGEIL